MQQEVDRFNAKSDKDGKIYIVVVTAQVSIFQPLSGPLMGTLGARTTRLLDGRHVNPTSDSGVFKIFGTDEIIRKIP
jgi:hypothetical protein